MPDFGVGYFYSINSGNGDAFDKVGNAIRAYITNKLQKPAAPEPGTIPPNAADYAGWYEPDSPRVQLIFFVERLLGLTYLKFHDGKMHMTNLGGDETFVPVSGGQFRYLPKKELPEPAATTTLLTPKDGVLYLQAGAGTTMKKLSTGYALLEIGVTGFVLLAVIAIALYAPFWILGGLSAKRRRPAERAMRVLPLLAVLSLVAFVVTFIVSSEDLIAKLGNVTGTSVLLCVTTVVFAIAVLGSGLAAWRTPSEGVRPAVVRFSKIVSLALLMGLAYLTYWGMIGLRTWE
jgi:hypothetical protein